VVARAATLSAMLPDHYQALGVRADASPEEIRAAYLRLMRESHPDARPDDPRAEQRARQANVAWEVLGDSARRAAYDRLRTVRAAGEEVRGDRVSRRRGDATVTTVAYNAERERYRQVVSRASMRFGVGAFAAGLLFLLALG